MSEKEYIIYEIVNPNVEYIYIGSTINFTRRKNEHKHVCNCPNNRGYNLNVYETIRNNGGWDKWKMRPLEKVMCISKTEARIREQFWIEKREHKLNEVKAYRSIENLHESQKQFYENYGKAYYEKNKEKLINNRKENYKKNVEKYAKYSKEYHQNNKEKRKLYAQKLHLWNKVRKQF